MTIGASYGLGVQARTELVGCEVSMEEAELDACTSVDGDGKCYWLANCAKYIA